MNDAMYEKLIWCSSEKEMIAIYTEPENNNSFFVGFLSAINEDNFILQHITPNGYYDGYILGETASIFKIEYAGKYQDKIHKLYDQNYKSKEEIKILIRDNLVTSLLNFAKNNSLIVSLKIGDDEMNISGFVMDCDSENIVIQQITEYGENDGIVYLDTDCITRIDCDTDYEQGIKAIR